MNKLICCNQESKWVENVPGKGYNFCEVCRNEVLTSSTIEEVKTDGDDFQWYWDNIPQDMFVAGGTGSGVINLVSGDDQRNVDYIQRSEKRIANAIDKILNSLTFIPEDEESNLIVTSTKPGEHDTKSKYDLISDKFDARKGTGWYT